MRLTFKEAQEAIRKQRLWVWRQKHWGKDWVDNDFDADLEETGYQYPGAAGIYFDVPNR